MASDLIDSLRAVVGDVHVVDDPQVLAGHLTDWMGKWHGHADAMARPADTAEVAAVMRLCAQAGVAVTAQGGNTGLVGGSVPLGGILLSTSRLTDLEPVDTVGATVGVGAGVTIDELDRHARAAGLSFGIDLASRESATAGGVVATNAGGVRFIRHGGTRAQVMGIEAVLANGSVLRRWSALAKDNVGYDLPGLLCGSEGTLAVITRVLFRLTGLPGPTVVTVAAINRVGAAVDLVAAIRDAGLTVEAAEMMTAAGVDLVTGYGMRSPVATPADFYTLIEVSGPGDLESAVTGVLERAPEVVDAVMEPGPASALWQIRESHTESIARSTTTAVVKLDVSVPLSELDATIADLVALTGHAGGRCRPILFGHVGDGNIHVNLLDVDPADAESLTDSVFEVIHTHRGSISAEHGIGRAKARWLHLGRTEVDIETMRAIKSALDPQWRLNPGVLFGE
ncbi:FAD-binding oxidoreductase [Gordonia jinhuaensis]|uniref:D-2-hydroxyacid dehydrogenase n=1 Tax=Gordonia jinhuaensis TaxID=1517702 RepID=A0A916T2K6_9ACTN|nr:FAD-binding oxidoreductase [Gordonia jinhuaensis]GGB29450.1 D-2-hydroxyacid dehydrogenase [Gordonia jinhuaensis]